MKKMFLFVTMAGVALASCTTDESVFDAAKENSKIEFVAANYTAQTRAEHDINVTFSNPTYQVWAWQDGEDATFINGESVNGSTNEIVSGNKYYWPTYALDFAAISPAGDKHIQLAHTGGITTVTYTFGTGDQAINHSVNLMHADFVTKNQESGAVDLKFRHVLAKLNVVVHQAAPKTTQAGITGYEVVIKNLAINDFKSQGNLVVKEGTYDATDDNLWTPVNPAVTEDWAILTSANQSIKSGDYVTAAPYYVMPQSLEDDVTLTIDYDVITTFTSGRTSTKANEKNIILSNIERGKIKNWFTNKNITYTINIAPDALNEISFTAKEEEWGTNGASHTF